MGNNLAFRDAGVQLIMIFESSNEKIRSSVFHNAISPWPLIGNPEKDLYRLYRVEESLYKMMKTLLVADVNQAKKDVKGFNLPKDPDATESLIPADFLINEDFSIHTAHYGKHLDDHIDFEDMKKFAGI